MIKYCTNCEKEHEFTDEDLKYPLKHLHIIYKKENKEQSMRQSVQRKQWLGSQHCDFCHIDLHSVPYFFDAKTTYGAWAVMCPMCFMEHGYGKIGQGWGQKYNSKFEKIGG